MLILLMLGEVQMFDADVSPACLHAVTTQLLEVERAATLQLLVSYKIFFREEDCYYLLAAKLAFLCGEA